MISGPIGKILKNNLDKNEPRLLCDATSTSNGTCTFGLTRCSRHNGPPEMQKVVTMQLAIRHSEHRHQWPWSNLLRKNWKTRDIHTMDDLFHKC